jgi:hypothetical protein
MPITRRFKPLERSILDYTAGTTRTMGQIFDHLSTNNRAYLVDAFDCLVREGWLIKVMQGDYAAPDVWTRRNMDLKPSYEWWWQIDGSEAYLMGLWEGEGHGDRLISKPITDEQTFRNELARLRDTKTSFGNGLRKPTIVAYTLGDELALIELFNERFGALRVDSDPRTLGSVGNEEGSRLRNCFD